MSPSDSSPQAPLAAQLGVPMKEREPVFEEPWQAQAFALAVLLSARGYFTWPEWAERLGEARREAATAAPPERPGALEENAQYYRCWVTALERLAAEKGLCNPQSLRERSHAWVEAYRRTPHGKPVELKAG